MVKKNTFLGTFKYKPSQEDIRFKKETKGMTRAEKNKWSSLPPSQRDRLRKEGFLGTGKKMPGVSKSEAWQLKQQTSVGGKTRYRKVQGKGPWIEVTKEQLATKKKIKRLPSQIIKSEESKAKPAKAKPLRKRPVRAKKPLKLRA